MKRGKQKTIFVWVGERGYEKERLVHRWCPRQRRCCRRVVYPG